MHHARQEKTQSISLETLSAPLSYCGMIHGSKNHPHLPMFKEKVCSVDSHSFISTDLSGSLGKLRILNVDLAAFGDTELNILGLARKNQDLKKQVVQLANKGFYLYKHENKISSFVQHDEIKKIWLRVKEGELKTFNSLFYKLQEPKINDGSKRLIVAFSSMNENIFSPSLSVRCLVENFRSIDKYIPDNCYVLRIADVGNAVCSFYLNNNYNKKMESDVQDLIRSIALEHCMSLEDDVVLYGPSKGGTAALYHALIGGYKAVSVDPIVSDEYYEEVYEDTHFTTGTFPETKQDKFKRVLAATKFINQINVIYSERSPQHPYIREVLKTSPISGEINFINSRNRQIQEHAHVSPFTLNVTLALINGMFYGFSKKRGISSSVI